MRMSEEKLLRELEERRENEILDIGVPQQCEESQEREDVEEEEVEKTSWEEMEEAGEMLMRNGADIPRYTSLDLPAFNALVEECADNLMMTTFKGLPRQKVSSATRIPGHIFIFMTLFWLRHYPTVDLLSILFRLHVRTCTQVLKRTTVALAKTLKEEVRFPTDEEMEELKHTTMQNHAFSNCVCIVDGSEIQISRPKNKELQRRTWSAKKKQNSLNVMFITKLNGEILFYSPFRIGAHDQSHWKELNLRQRFVGKTFGIMGDGGFHFNTEDDEEKIIGYKPFKKPKGGLLTQEQKDYNTKLSEIRVVVENAIRVVKVFTILGGVFRHFRNGAGQINEQDILTICVSLANRKIRKTPLRSCDWTASDWREVFELLPPLSPYPNEEMFFDVENGRQ